jgi:hypothetical protein
MQGSCSAQHAAGTPLLLLFEQAGRTDNNAVAAAELLQQPFVAA